MVTKIHLKKISSIECNITNKYPPVYFEYIAVCEDELFLGRGFTPNISVWRHRQHMTWVHKKSIMFKYHGYMHDMCNNDVMSGHI